MSKNIKQVYDANPITANEDTDLMYFGQDPYGTGDDAAMTFEDFKKQFPEPSVIDDAAQNSLAYYSGAGSSDEISGIAPSPGGMPFWNDESSLTTAYPGLFPVYAVQTSAVAVTYDNGTSGVGATLTYNANGVLTVDSSTPPVGSYILYVAQSASAQNGLYVVADAGSVSSQAVVIRAACFDTPAKMSMLRAFVALNGSQNYGRILFSTYVSITTIGTNPITFSTLANTYNGGSGIELSQAPSNSSSTLTMTTTNGGVGFTGNASASFTAGRNSVTMSRYTGGLATGTPSTSSLVAGNIWGIGQDVQNTTGVRIQAPAGVTINCYGTETAVAGYLQFNQVGGIVYLRALTTTYWTVEYSVVKLFGIDEAP